MPGFFAKTRNFNLKKKESVYKDFVKMTPLTGRGAIRKINIKTDLKKMV